MFFIRNVREHNDVPVRGLTIITSSAAESSISKVVLDLARKLRLAGIGVQVFEADAGSCGGAAGGLEEVSVPADEFSLLKYDHVLLMFEIPLPGKLPVKVMRTAFWEFGTGFLACHPEMADDCDMIAFSDFNAEVFRRELNGRAEVVKVLYPLVTAPDVSTAGLRGKYGIGESDFVVFFNFDYRSSYNRKNPEGVVRAFAKAFTGVAEAKLVFKTKGAKMHEERAKALKRLAEELKISERVIMIDDFISEEELYGLTAVCDVYLSLHRGEGFGLGIAEAMSMGKPVVVTDYGGPVEFCRPECSVPVPYELAKVPSAAVDNECYRHVREWAEPDVDAAASALTELYRDPVRRERIGASARRFISEYFSVENFRASVQKLLSDNG